MAEESSIPPEPSMAATARELAEENHLQRGLVEW